MIQKQEKDKSFIDKLKNPLNPVNDTKCSPIMEKYLEKLNTPALHNNDHIRRYKKETTKEQIRLCPFCRSTKLNMTNQRSYECGDCGKITNNPQVYYK